MTHAHRGHMGAFSLTGFERGAIAAEFRRSARPLQMAIAEYLPG